MQAQARYVFFVASNHFERPATLVVQEGSDRGNLLGQHEGEAAQGVDVFLDLAKARKHGLGLGLGPGLGLGLGLGLGSGFGLWFTNLTLTLP